VARRVVIHEITRRRMAEALGHVAAQHPSFRQAQAPARELQRIDNREEIQMMLRDLPHGDAEVVKQFHLEGKSYREISTRLGIPENSIGPTLNRARQRLITRRGKVS